MVILHGENLALSRQKLQELVSRFRAKGKTEIIRLEGEKVKLGEILQALESGSLFGNEKLVIIENIFSATKSKEKEAILVYFKKTRPENLLIWEKKKVDGRTLASFPAEVLKFDITPIVFRFLDSLAPDNKKTCLLLLQQSLAQNEAEMIFYLLVRQVKTLILASSPGVKGLSAVPPWKKERIVFQAKKFGLEKLMAIYRQLLEIDWQQKTGQTVLDLSSQLDLLIAGL